MTNTIEIENLNISDLDIPTDETLQEVATACEDIATSSQGIATSCESVATSCSELAKDTTLQSTNTALGSLATDATLQATNTALGGLNTSLGGIIKDATGQSIDASVGSIATVLSDVATDTTLAEVAKDTTLQATNTALGYLMADTTGQSIASAITALGSTLGSDKANIDGSNIANPSAFRQSIGCEWETITNAISDPNSNVEEVVLKKCNGVVYIALTTKQKTYNEGDVLFTLTNNAVIPLNIQRLVCWSYAPDKCYTISVKTDGTVDCYGRGSITGRLIFNGFYFAE